MVQDFSTQFKRTRFSPFYLHKSVWLKIARHPVYMSLLFVSDTIDYLLRIDEWEIINLQ